MKTLTIELTNKCNLSCTMCTVRTKDNTPPSFISQKNFIKILNEISNRELEIEQLRLFWLGEPLLHPDFSNLMDCLSEHSAITERFIRSVSLDTNGTMLGNLNLQSLLSLSRQVPLNILFSLDSLDPEVYSRIRVGASHPIVVRSLIQLLEAKARNYRFPYPRVAVQLIIMPENQSQIPADLKTLKDMYISRGLEFKIMLNASSALADGVNLRPLTVQWSDRQEDQGLSDEMFLKLITRLKQDLELKQYFE